MSALADSATSPVERFEFTTRDVTQAHQVLRDTYGEHRVRLRGSTENFTFRQLTATSGPLALDQLRHSMRMAITAEPIDYLMSVLVLDGQLRARAGRDEVRLARDDVLLHRCGEPLSIDWDDVQVFTVRLPVDEVARMAAARWGIEAAAFRFEGMTPVSAEMGQYWRDTVAYLHRAFEEPHAAVASPLLRAALIEFTASAELAVFPNTATSACDTRGPGRVAPAALRRAVGFIDAHAGEPVTLAQIAEAAGVTGRALQHTFLRYYSTSPTGYLRRVRLERAHRELQAADPTTGVTVATIARRWGWANPAHFAAAYRQAYGQLPSYTLRT
jgi:AraC-like DNA-binding protein